MEFLIYDAKVAVLIAVFYMFYRLMLARETFHRVNRVVLLLTAVACWGPSFLCDILIQNSLGAQCSFSKWIPSRCHCHQINLWREKMVKGTLTTSL